ncbi:putative ribonucleotide reductase [Phialemonium atrogriseum]|uniref:Ribonucleotide reductase n=1 Tax=Phialemonium atrogriseum TaxID=1093897 RepID=A0AAJ0FK08_9PEZI|nr:putative ribonucleotide reductase [Phialemonium atrogriseum]KAK1763620.1 putative ribonucleotide reductase [Phialemonium atrogriseum]
MSAPRTKRQFAGAASDPAQRQITSYFYKGPDGARTSPDPAAAAAVISPELPAHVQSNLLNVGMRVRKSVPEGYKTGSSYSAFALWADADADAGSSPPSTAPTPTPTPAAGSALSSRRELLPFCGIHKVGGLAAQPAWSLSPSATATEDHLILLPVPALDDVPSLTSSQESAASTDDDHHPVIPTISVTAAAARGPATGSNSNNRKRAFVGDEGEGEVPAPFSRPHGLGVWRDRAEWLDGEVSPRSLAPAGWENARVMAVARRRSSGKGVARAALPLEDLGQENMAVDDFGEAEFLDYRYGREMEVE